MDRYSELFELLTSDTDDDVTIRINGNDPDSLVATFSDGSEMCVYWHHNAQRWVIAEGANTSCPCDVAARDTL